MYSALRTVQRERLEVFIMCRPTLLSSCTAVVLLLNLVNVLAQTELDDDPYNIKKFNNLRLNDPKNLCLYLKCISPMKTCPEGTFWRENVAMYGCCGGCVRFKVLSDDCTGSVDPLYGGGYCEKNDDDELSCPLLKTRKSEESLDISISTFKASLRESTTDDNIIHSSWCGYGLECQQFGSNTCQNPNQESGSRNCKEVYENLYNFTTNETIFDERRDDYIWLPDCTIDGLYKSKQCKGPIDEQRCVCVDPNGGSIYGAAYPFQEELYNTMNCECSRRVWEQKQSEGIESPTLHCLENGNYEPLQCENGYCYCIDPNNTVTYGPTVPEKAMFILPCYNTTLLGENKKYLRLCDSKSHAHNALGTYMKEKGISVIPLSSVTCDPDGSFSGLQCDSGCDCVDKSGDVTQSSVKPVECNCKRDTDLLASLGQNTKPTCRGNSGGYYNYHSDSNGAYCMDEHGIRSSPKVRKEYCCLLRCNSAKDYCQKKGQTKYCEKTCLYDEEKPCPQCVYASYQGDNTSECDDIECGDSNTECTDINYGFKCA